MKQTTVGGTKKKVKNIAAMIVLILVFIVYMFPFLMVVINSLKEKRDIIKSPFSWLFTMAPIQLTMAPLWQVCCSV